MSDSFSFLHFNDAANFKCDSLAVTTSRILPIIFAFSSSQPWTDSHWLRGPKTRTFYLRHHLSPAEQWKRSLPLDELRRGSPSWRAMKQTQLHRVAQKSHHVSIIQWERPLPVLCWTKMVSQILALYKEFSPKVGPLRQINVIQGGGTKKRASHGEGGKCANLLRETWRLIKIFASLLLSPSVTSRGTSVVNGFTEKTSSQGARKQETQNSRSPSSFRKIVRVHVPRT